MAFQVKDSDLRKTSEVNGMRAKVYSTDESVKVEFDNGDIEAGAWLTPTQAAELIELLQAVFVKEQVA